MLDKIRSGAQSFGVKIAFGLIILVFVFWGVGNFNDRDYSNVVAVVNGEPIVALQFEKAYHNAEESLLRNNPGLTREQLAKEGLSKQVLNMLIRETLLAQEARRAGVEVTPEEMRMAVGQMKAFQNDAGKFDPEAYKRVLAAQRMSPAQFEKDLSDQMLQDKIFALVTAPAWVDPDEALNRFNFLRERRVIDYLFVPADKFFAKVETPETELKTWYEEHKSDFAIPAMVDVEYIALKPEDLVNRENIGEAKAKAWYEANKSKFQQPEQVHASHILVAAPADASLEDEKAAREKVDKILADLKAGKSFASIADKVNEPNAADKGGDLGWIAKGQTVPEFEAVAFELPVGQVSAPVRTPFGWHLIEVTEKREAGAKQFEEVKDEVYRELAFEDGSEKLHEALDNLIEDNILQKPLAEAAKRYGLKAEATGLLAKQDLMKKLNLKAEAADSLLNTPAGAPLDTALEAGDSYIIARIAKVAPAAIKDFETVKEDIQETLIAEKALALAMENATAILAKIKTESIDKVKKDHRDLKTSDVLERGGMIAGFLPDETFMEAVFTEPGQTWLERPYLLAESQDKRGAAIAYIDKIMEPAPGEFEGVATILGNAARQQRMDGLYAMFLQQLAKNAKVEITNQNLIDRINM